MPRYDYKCPQCGDVDEVVMSVSQVDSHIERCTCGAFMNRVIYPVAISFKGGGFYKTDNRKEA